MTAPKTIKIDGVEFVRADSVSTVSATPGESLYKVGLKVFIRSVTYHYVGQISYIDENEVVLENASWVAYSGRWHTAISTGKLDEVEPYGDVPTSINRKAIVDMSVWKHSLPTEAK